MITRAQCSMPIDVALMSSHDEVFSSSKHPRKSTTNPIRGIVTSGLKVTQRLKASRECNNQKTASTGPLPLSGRALNAKKTDLSVVNLDAIFLNTQKSHASLFL